MLPCGLRVSEVSNLRWEAIDMTQGTLRVHNSKGPVDRMVSLSPMARLPCRSGTGSGRRARIADKLTMPGNGNISQRLLFSMSGMLV